MERRVAKFLQGSRTPMSGAAAKYKGDVSVEFINNPGRYIIECKLSDDSNVDGEPRIAVKLQWFSKIQQEATAMRCKFGILVIHYHGHKEDYVFIRSDHLDWVFTRSSRADVINAIISANIEADNIATFPDGKKRTLYGLERKRIEQRIFRDIMGFKVGAVQTPDGKYYVIELQQFRDLLEGI